MIWFIVVIHAFVGTITFEKATDNAGLAFVRPFLYISYECRRTILGCSAHSQGLRVPLHYDCTIRDLINNLENKRIQQSMKNINGVMKIVRFILILLFISASTLEGQELKTGVAAETWNLVKTTSDEFGTKSGAFILLKESILTVDKNKMTTEKFHIIGKILDQKARLDYAQIPLLFNSYYEEVHLDYARTLHPDSTVLNTFSDAVMIESLPKLEGGIKYSDTRALTFSLPGLDVGVVFEFQVTIKEKKPIIEHAWFMEHYFNYILRNLASPSSTRADPVLNSRLTIHAPKHEKFLWDMKPDSLAPILTKNTPYDEYRWELHKLPEIYFEPGMPAYNLLSPNITFSSLDSWKQIDQWAEKKILRSASTTPLMKHTVAIVTQGAMTKEEKIERIYHYIQREVKYVSADLERGGYTPHNAEDVLKNRYGDCKDQTVLFIALLAASGIDAYPALLNPFGYPEQLKAPVPYFSHVITYIPNGNSELWLDSTPGVTPFPRLYVTNQDRLTFIINGRGGSMLKTPRSTVEENTYMFFFSVVRNGARADVTIQFSGSGAASDGLKQMFTSMNKEHSYQLFQSLILFQYKNAMIDSVVVSDVQNPEQPFSANVYFHMDSVWTEKVYRFSYGNNMRIALEFFLNNADFPHPDTRHYSMNLLFPYSLIGVEKYSAPSMEFTKSFLPDNDSLTTPYFHCERKFRKTSVGVTARWVMTQLRTGIPLDAYKEFYTDVAKMKKMLTWSVIFYVPVEKGYYR